MSPVRSVNYVSGRSLQTRDEAPPAGLFLFGSKALAETPEPRRLAPGRISFSERPSVSNRANLVGNSSVGKVAVI